MNTALLVSTPLKKENNITIPEKELSNIKCKENNLNCTDILQSSQLYIHNTRTNKAEIIFNVEYKFKKSHVEIKGCIGFGKSMRLNIRYDELEYIHSGDGILTFNEEKIKKYTFFPRLKKTPYMIQDCASVVKIQCLYGKDSATPLKIKSIASASSFIPKFREGVIAQYNQSFILYDTSNTNNYVSNIFSITYLMNDAYLLQLVDDMGVIIHSEIIRASCDGIVSIMDKDTYSLRIIPLHD